MSKNDCDAAEHYVLEALGGDRVTCFGCGASVRLGFVFEESDEDRAKVREVLRAHGWRLEGASVAAPLGTSVVCPLCASMLDAARAVLTDVN